jgi:RNA polymerase sigma-70 factor (ECF subfamily)
LKPSEQTIYKYLVKRSIEGDRQAQNELYKLFANAMFNISRRMMGNEEDARDVLQESFIEAFTKMHTLQNEVTFPAWLKRIVVNKCINALRKKKVMMEELNENYDQEIKENDDDFIIQAKAKKVMKALNEISQGCRTVFNLYLFEGYDHKEIASILDISESASKAQYSKAKSKVRKLLETETL